MSIATSSFSIQQLMCVRQDEVLFKNLSVELNPGELLTIEGPNGSGKSTLLRILAGFSRPLVGDVLWHSQSIYSHLQAFIAHAHYLGHHNGLRQSLTVNENLRLVQLHSLQPMYLRPVLQTLGLEKITSVLIRDLSAGQKRRVALVKLLCVPRKLWLLDEPLSALDTAAQTLFTQHLASHLQLGGMAIVSTHQPILIDYPLSKKIILPMSAVGP